MRTVRCPCCKQMMLLPPQEGRGLHAPGGRGESAPIAGDTPADTARIVECRCCGHMFSESQGDLAKRPIPFSAPVQRTKPREPSQPVQESKENILAQIHIKLARKRELQAELDDLGRWAMDHPEGDWNDSARSYRVSMDAIDDEIEKLQSKL